MAESGRASTEWTLGAAGHQALVAETGIASVEFTATSFVADDPSFLAITTRRLAAAYPSFAHADTLQAVGGRAPYTWGLAGGALPPGLTLTPDGVILGRPQSEGRSSFTVRVVDGGGIEASGAFELEVCGTPLELEVGEVHITAPAAPGGCGFSVRAESAGSYYRVTLVGTSAGFEVVEPVQFRLVAEMREGTVAARSPTIGSPARLGSGVQLSTPAQGAPEDHHLEIRQEEARLLAGLAREGRIRALPDLRAAASAPADPPPETWEFRLGSPGTVADNCTVATRTTTVLQGYNDHLALYADTVPFAVLAPQNIPILLSHYERYGAEVIESWGGVADIDGNGRIIVYLDKNMPDPLTGLVWVGDMLPASVCAASNEAELIRIDQSWLPQTPSVLASTLVHEAQHVSSVYKRLLNTLDEPFDGSAQHPPWVEEGRAVMAAETASRLAWAELGGPASHEQVTAAHLAHLSTDQLGLSGIFTALDRIKRVLREDANSLTHFPDPYGSGWHFHRFLRRLVRGCRTGPAGRRAVHEAARGHGDTGRRSRDRRGHGPVVRGADARVRHGNLAGRHRGAPARGSATLLDLRLHGSGRHVLPGGARPLSVARHDERGGTRRPALGAARGVPHDGTGDQGERRPDLRPARIGPRRGGDRRGRRTGPCVDRGGPDPRPLAAGEVKPEEAPAESPYQRYMVTCTYDPQGIDAEADSKSTGGCFVAPCETIRP